jgi:thiol-disulfide isomerase/thioredoxin
MRGIPVLTVRQQAPPIAGVTFPAALWFFKTNCPTCKMAHPYAEKLAKAYPSIPFVGVVQGSVVEGRTFGATFELVADAAPYRYSRAYGLEFVPMLFLVNADGEVEQVVEVWNRDGYNQASHTLARWSQTQTVEIAGAEVMAFRQG